MRWERILEVMGAAEKARLDQRKIPYLSIHPFSGYDLCLVPGWYPGVGKYVFIGLAHSSPYARGNRVDIQKLAWCVETPEAGVEVQL
jgi:hypothetical protein